MLKKSLAVAIFCSLLTACSSKVSQPSYMISDEDTKKWILEGNKAEQCLFENRNIQNLSMEESFLHRAYVWDLPLIQTITFEKVKLLSKDQASLIHLNQQIQKFNNSNKVEFDQHWCNNLKKQAKTDLAQIKEYIKQQQALAVAQQKEAEKRRILAEKERKAREAYLRTPAGQAELARQQQHEFQQQLLAQQQQMIELQREAIRQAASAEYNNSINQMISDLWQNAPSVRTTNCYGYTCFSY